MPRGIVSLVVACLLLLASSILGSAQTLYDIRQLTLTTNDILFDPFSDKIYASVPSSVGSGGNSIVAIDPVTGSVGSPVFIGSEPGKLAVSDNGQYLYVALDGAASVRRFDIATQTAGLQFALGTDDFTGPYYAEDIEVLPGNPEAIAVSRRNQGFSPRHEGVAIYDNGVKLPNETPGHTGSNVIEFSATASRLYGYNNETTEFGFRRMSVDDNGVSVLDVTENLISGFNPDISFDNGVIYSTTGRALDPEARILLGTYTGVGSGSLVLPDASVGRVFFLTGDGSTRVLRTYDMSTFVPLDTFDVPGVSDRHSSLVRWGNGGLAFRTDASQVFLLTPLSAVNLASFTLKPSAVAGCKNVTGKVVLSTPAPSGGAQVTLANTNSAASVPANVTVPAGATTKTFTITTTPVSSIKTGTVTATLGAASISKTLKVRPIGVASVALNPNPVVGGNTVNGTVTLECAAAPGDITVALSSTNPAVANPAVTNITIPAGSKTGTFTVNTSDVSVVGYATIKAKANGISKGRKLTVNP